MKADVDEIKTQTNNRIDCVLAFNSNVKKVYQFHQYQQNEQSPLKWKYIYKQTINKPAQIRFHYNKHILSQKWITT